MRIAAFLSVTLLSAAAVAVPAAAAEVRGSVSGPSVVWINDGSNAPATTFDMRNRDRQFVPGMLVIRAGQSVRFPNDDPIYHSIYSPSVANPFDIGYYGNGPGKTIAFDKPGLVEVRCHIHFSMQGVIIVTDGPSSGGLVKNFILTNVLPGTHTLYIRTERGDLKTKTVTVPNASSKVDLGSVS